MVSCSPTYIHFIARVAACLHSLPPSCLQLLEKKKRVQLKDMGEDLECLCQIMRTIGPRLDHEKARVSTPSPPPLIPVALSEAA